MRRLIVVLIITLGTSFAFGAGYYTSAGVGSKDASNWANAGDLARFEADIEANAPTVSIFYVAGSNTYTLTDNIIEDVNNGTEATPIRVVGVALGTTTPVTGTDRPLFDGVTGNEYLQFNDYWSLENLRYTGSSGALPGVRVDQFCKVVNCHFMDAGNVGALFVAGVHTNIIDCELQAASSSGIVMSKDNLRVMGCYIHDSVKGIEIDVARDYHVFINNIIEACTTGIDISPADSDWILCVGNTLQTGTTGILSNTTGNSIFANNIIDGYTGNGAVWTTEQGTNYFDYNCWNNTVDGNNITLGVNAVVADPLLAADFTLGAGSPCLDSGMQFIGSSGITGDFAINIGADQDDNAAGGTTINVKSADKSGGKQ